MILQLCDLSLKLTLKLIIKYSIISVSLNSYISTKNK